MFLYRYQNDIYFAGPIGHGAGYAHYYHPAPCRIRDTDTSMQQEQMRKTEKPVWVFNLLLKENMSCADPQMQTEHT